MILRLRETVVRYPGAPRLALAGVDLAVARGELVAVVGPNGSGKTTLLRAALGTVALQSGEAQVLGRDVRTWRRRELAKVVAVVTQREEQLFPLRVQEVVLFGRYARLGAFSAESDADLAAVGRAMERCDVLPLADRRVDTLSGGEWQRVRVARALAQEPEAMVLDEPTAALDVRHEMEVFELIRSLVAGGLSAVVITHHLNLAARYADRMLLLEEGAVAAQGTPTEVLQRERVARVFGWPVAITTWCDGAPQVVPLRPAESL